MNRQEEVEVLLRAFVARDIEAIRALGEAGLDLDAPGGAGLTVLMRAILQGHAVTVEWILAAGADPNAPGRDGTMALDLAHALDRSDLVDLLIAAGAKGRVEAPHRLKESELETLPLPVGVVACGEASASHGVARRASPGFADRLQDELRDQFDDEIDDSFFL